MRNLHAAARGWPLVVAVLAASGCEDTERAAVVAPVTQVAIPAPTPVPLPPEPAAPTATAPSRTLDDFAGLYSITGAPEIDECHASIYLAARNIVVTPDGSLTADVVNRTYAARVVHDSLVAEGEFDPGTGCGGQLHERWVFESDRTGLHGELLSEWPLPPNCDRCRVVFSIRAHYIGPAGSAVTP